MIVAVKILEGDRYESAKLQYCTENHVIKLSPAEVHELKEKLIEMEP